jgi:hypothetical protein
MRFGLEPLITNPSQYVRISCTTWALLCEEVGNVARESGHHTTFKQWNAHKNSFLELTDHSPESVFRKIQALRHEAFSISEQGDWTTAAALTEKAISIAKEMGVEDLITQRKTHALFEMRKHRELAQWSEFEKTLDDAVDRKLLYKSPTQLESLLDPSIDPPRLDSWAECHMQNLRVAFLDEIGQKKRAANLFDAYAGQYKKPHGIKATKNGNISNLAPYLAHQNIQSIWEPLPKSLLLLINSLEAKMIPVIEQQKVIAEKWRRVKT